MRRLRVPPFRAHVVLWLALLLAAGPAMSALAQSATPVASPVAVADLRGVPPAPFDAARMAELDAYAVATMRQMGVAGASIAVTQDGRVVYARGFGVRTLGGSEPVTPDTRFMIGSVTKGMTSLMAATVVDDGLATWDTRLTNLLPSLRLSDPSLTDRVTLADSFCACTGLPRDDLPVVLSRYATPAELVAGMADIAVTAPFGETFQYSNQMYAVGGYAATTAAGGALDTMQADYARAMQDRVLGPIGMADSTFDLGAVLASGNYARPTGADVLGQPQRVPLLADDRFAESIAPAGALWSTATDIARYLATETDGGVAPDGVRVVSAANLARTQAERLTLPAEANGGAPPELAALGHGYAMGWLTGTWHGQTVLSHGGSTLGFAAQVGMLPESRLGVAVLSNGGLNGNTFGTSVQQHVFESAFGLAPELDPVLAPLLAAQQEAIAAARDALRPIDPAAVRPYLGTYHNPRLGDLRLTLDGDTLTLALGPFRTALQPSSALPANAYLPIDAPLASPVQPAPFVLRTGADGRPEVSVEMPSETVAMEFVFTRTGG